jgi:hypothetical protein
MPVHLKSSHLRLFVRERGVPMSFEAILYEIDQLHSVPPQLEMEKAFVR